MYLKLNHILKSKDITIKFEDMPKFIVGMCSNVLNTKYILVNKNLNEKQQVFITLACLYCHIYKKEMRIFTLDDMYEISEDAALIYAKENLEQYAIRHERNIS